MITYEQAERLESFREERFHAIRSARFTRADDKVIPLQTGPKAVLHLVPVGAVEPIPRAFEMATVATKHIDRIGPITGILGALQRQNTFEGVRTYAISSKTEAVYKYALWFRTGAVEDVHVFRDGEFLQLQDYERAVREQLRDRIGVLADMVAKPPIVVTLSILDASGKSISGDSEWGTYPVESDELVAPSLVIRDYASDPADGLRVVFEALRNAGGVA